MPLTLCASGSLLIASPHSGEFLEDEEHRILGYIGEFGSGSRMRLAAKLIFLGLKNPGANVDGRGAVVPNDPYGPGAGDGCP